MILIKQGQKCPLDMLERKKREDSLRETVLKETHSDGRNTKKYDREREVKGRWIERVRKKGRGIELERVKGRR